MNKMTKYCVMLSVLLASFKSFGINTPPKMYLTIVNNTSDEFELTDPNNNVLAQVKANSKQHNINITKH